jgi:hypothetical protein
MSHCAAQHLERDTVKRIVFALTLMVGTLRAQPAANPTDVKFAGSATPVTIAAHPSPEQLKQAKAQAREARPLLNRKDFAGARPILEAAFATAPEGSVLVDLVSCYRGLGLNAQAHQLLLQAQAAGNITYTTNDTKLVTSHSNQLALLTTRLFVTVPEGPNTITLDGAPKELPTGGVPLVLEPGRHQLKVERPNSETFVKDFEAAPGQEERINVEFQAYVATGRLKVVEKNGRDIDVVVDGKVVGKAPWEANIEPGRHLIEGKSPRAVAAGIAVDVARRGSVEVALESVVQYERLVIQANTEGATATLDAQPIKLPFNEYVPLGQHQLKVTAPGYAPVDRSIVLIEDQPVTEIVALTANARVSSPVSPTPKGPGVRVGALLGIISIPRPINLELSIKPNELLGFGVGYSMFPPLEFDDVEVGIQAFNAVGRVFPFKGAFYVGLGFGYQMIDLEATRTIDGDAVTATIDESNLFITPQVGWLWIWDSGFALGINLGVQFALSSNPNVTLTDDRGREIRGPSGEEEELRDDVRNIGEWVADIPIPSVDLLKLGFYF